MLWGQRSATHQIPDLRESHNSWNPPLHLQDAVDAVGTALYPFHRDPSLSAVQLSALRSTCSLKTVVVGKCDRL